MSVVHRVSRIVLVVAVGAVLVFDPSRGDLSFAALVAAFVAVLTLDALPRP